MKTILYTLLIVMALFSGFLALSNDDNDKKKPATDNNEKNLAEILAKVNKKDDRTMVYSRIPALIVYIISIASMVTIYLIKG